MKLAIVDLDWYRDRAGTINPMIADIRARSQKAKEAADGESKWQKTRTFFDTLFDPTLVELDELEPGALKHIEALQLLDFEVIILTSRPHTMEQATRAWLSVHGLGNLPVTFKNYGEGDQDKGDRFMKTSAWKRREVERVIREYEAQGYDPQWVIFADDEETNRQAIAEMNDPRLLIRCSLEDAARSDHQRYPIEEQAPALLQACQRLVNTLECRELWESDEEMERTIRIFDAQDRSRESMTLMLKAWGASESRVFQVSQLFPQQSQFPNMEALRILMLRWGEVLDVSIEQEGELRSAFEGDDERADHEHLYAHEYMAHQVTEDYEAARYWRAAQLFDEAVALRDYEEAQRLHNARTQEAMRQAAMARHKGEAQ